MYSNNMKKKYNLPTGVDPELGLQPLYGAFDFQKMKLSQYEEGMGFGVHAFKRLNTKYGETYVMLTTSSNLVMANKKIVSYINKYISKNFQGDESNLFYHTDSAVMFTVQIGALKKYDEHEYNEIDITPPFF